MQLLFADTSYYQALLNRKDDLHSKAARIGAATAGFPIVTTHLVLVELLNAFSASGTVGRLRIAEYVRTTVANAKGRVIALDAGLFLYSLRLYESRLDKNWGFADCVSFEVMRQLGISMALTADVHFVQAGFRALLREA